MTFALTYIDIALLVLVFLSLLILINIRSKINKRIDEIEQKIASLKKYQDDIFAGLNSRYGSIKEVLVDKVNKYLLD